MLFWILVAAMTAAVAALLLYPLLRGGKTLDDTRAGEAAVYRDQLRELDRDLSGGLITSDEADYARAEIGRRLIAVSATGAAAEPKAARHHRFSEAFILLLLPVIGLCLYVAMGRPDLPSQPLQARLDNPGNDMAILVSKAERHLALNPEDGKGWDVLAPIYFNAMRVADAEKAYRNAIRLLGPSAMRLDGLAESMMAGSNGMVTPEVRQTLEQSLSLEPDNPRAKFYVALSLEQGGETEKARAAFEAIAKESPADAPWLPLVNDHIAKNGGAAIASGKAPGGPTQEDVAAAQNMTPADQQQMIRGMVESLDAKLKADPNNFEGWVRLVRSYAVLNDKDRAEDALKRGLAVFPVDGDQGKQLLALGRELGIATEGVTE